MVFLADKYKVETLFDVRFNKHIYTRIIKRPDENESYSRFLEQVDDCATANDFKQCIYRHIYMGGMTEEEYYNRYVQLPNLFVYGPSGSGKKTFIRLLLEDMFNKSINNTVKVTHQIVGYGNSTEDKDIEQSNYHIIIEPDNSGFDRYVMQEIISEYAQHAPLKVSGCRTPFKVVLINNADNLSPYAQKALRCTMEKYHRTCKFILCCSQGSKVIKALRSRCLQIRIPRPTNKDIFNILYDVSCKENIDISIAHINQIVYLARRNIKIAYALLNIYQSNYVGTNRQLTNDIYTLSWIDCMQKIVDMINNFLNLPRINNLFTPSFIELIRDMLYTIFTTNISGGQMITQFTILVMRTIKFEPKLFAIVMQLIANYEARITNGKKMVMHMEALIMNILYQIHYHKINV
jgi:replication factor C subunit 3/5